MLWSVAVIAVLCALVTYFGMHSALILLLFALAVAAHVAGNALGTQLRANGDRPLPSEDGTVVRKTERHVPTADEFAPASELRRRSSLGFPIVIATVCGSLLTAAAGGLLMAVLLERTPTWTARIAGTVACGTLGGIWTFVAFSFIQVTGGAWRQATRKVDSPRDTLHPG